MRKGLTNSIDSIIESVSQMESVKPYLLVGGTALAMQIGHRKSEDLDFMMWRKSKSELPEIEWPKIEHELNEKIGKVESINILSFHQVEFVVKDVKFSFYVSNNYCPVSEPINYLGNIYLADINSILGMKIEVLTRRAKFRDYYDIYSILKEGYELGKGIETALKYQQHKLKTKNLIMMLLSNRIMTDENFEQLEPKHKVSKEEIRQYILKKLPRF